MPLTTSRMFTVRGWPPSLGAGIRDSNMAHSWSVRSLGYLFSSFSISLPSPHHPSLLSYLLFKHPLRSKGGPSMIAILGSIEGELDGHQVFLSAEGQELRLEIDHPHRLLRTLNAGRSVSNTAVRRLAREL